MTTSQTGPAATDRSTTIGGDYVAGDKVITQTIAGDAVGRDKIVYQIMVAPGTNGGTLVEEALPPRISERPVAHRPPQPPYLFLDRVDETQRATQALADTTHAAVALSGPTGTGKSTLLHYLANHLPRAYPDGVVWISGEADGAPASLDEVAQALFEAQYESHPPAKLSRDTIRGYLKPGLLYVLDGVALSPAELDQLPTLCQFVMWSAIRPPRGEAGLVIEIGGLPRPQARTLLATLSRAAPGAADTPEADQICGLLDDQPQALVIIGRWVRTHQLTLAGAAQALQQAAAASPAKGARLATAAVIAALPEVARTLLGLAGAAGGPIVSRAALIEASGLGDDTAGAALDQLEALGLIEAHSPEYSLHAATRDAVRAQLPVDGDRLRRLTDSLLREAHDAAAGGAAQIGNLLSALEWNVRAADAGRVRAVAQALVGPLVLRGRWEQWQRLFQVVAAAGEQAADDGLRGWALHELGTHALALGDFATARRTLDEALALRALAGDAAGVAATQHNADFLRALPLRPGRPRAGGRPSAGVPPALAAGLVAVVVLAVAAVIGAARIIDSLRAPTPTPVVATHSRPTSAPPIRTTAPPTRTPRTPTVAAHATTLTPSPTVTASPSPTDTQPPTPTDTPMPTPYGGGSGELDFASEVEGPFTLYGVDGLKPAELHVIAPFAEFVREDIMPAWSPHGERLAFVEWVGSDDFNLHLSNGQDLEFDLGVVNSFAADLAPAWSPDGTQIAFMSNRGADVADVEYRGDFHIFVFDPRADAAPVPIGYKDGNALFPTWSPDGKQIAFSSNRDGSWQLYVMTVEGLDPTRLTSDGEETVNWYPAWSPDGQRIAFSARQRGVWHIYVLDLASGKPMRLTTSDVNELFPQWSPDGRLITYAAEVPGREDNGGPLIKTLVGLGVYPSLDTVLEVFVAPYDGRKPHAGSQVTSHFAVSVYPTWKP